jgi:hypothetical protein
LILPFAAENNSFLTSINLPMVGAEKNIHQPCPFPVTGHHPFMPLNSCLLPGEEQINQSFL